MSIDKESYDVYRYIFKDNHGEEKNEPDALLDEIYCELSWIFYEAEDFSQALPIEESEHFLKSIEKRIKFIENSVEQLEKFIRKEE